MYRDEPKIPVRTSSILITPTMAMVFFFVLRTKFVCIKDSKRIEILRILINNELINLNLNLFTILEDSWY